MPAVRVALAQINPTVGDLAGNSNKILSFCAQAHRNSAKLVIFPELALSGYPIEDLALAQDFLTSAEAALQELAAELESQGLGDLQVLLGHPGKALKPTSWAIGENRASLIQHGKVQSSYAKHHLPNYSVFDEYRTFVPGNKLAPFSIDSLGFSTLICEDIWQQGGPVAQIASSNTDITLVLNGSPFETSKDDTRLDLVTNLAKQTDTAVIYLNLIGGQDDLVFDGNSFVVDAEGREVFRMAQFEEQLSFIDIASKTDIKPTSNTAILNTELGQIWNALVLGVRDYVAKNNFRTVVLGLSGGIDSAVCATIAADAIGAENVHGIAMPSKYSSAHSLEDASRLSENLGLKYQLQEIDQMVEPFATALHLSGLAAENIQARVRALILMASSNQNGHLVLTTSNKTELAVGYSTIYGDSVGGFAPIKDVEKTLVWELARYRNSLAAALGLKPPIPESSISKAPSAELRPNQTDQDSLPPYELLDGILRGFIEQRQSVAQLVSDGFDQKLVDEVIELVSKAEWKRRQGAIGPRITPMAFGRERRFPITNRIS